MIPNPRINTRTEMTAEPTFDFAERLVAIERGAGMTLAQAIASVARHARIGNGTLENILRRRVKHVSGVVRDRITAALMAALNRQIESLSNELAVVRSTLCADPQSVAEIEADIAALAARMKELRK